MFCVNDVSLENKCEASQENGEKKTKFEWEMDKNNGKHGIVKGVQLTESVFGELGQKSRQRMLKHSSQN